MWAFEHASNMLNQKLEIYIIFIILYLATVLYNKIRSTWSRVVEMNVNLIEG